MNQSVGACIECKSEIPRGGHWQIQLAIEGKSDQGIMSCCIWCLLKKDYIVLINGLISALEVNEPFWIHASFRDLHAEGNTPDYGLFGLGIDGYWIQNKIPERNRKYSWDEPNFIGAKSFSPYNELYGLVHSFEDEQRANPQLLEAIEPQRQRLGKARLFSEHSAYAEQVIALVINHDFDTQFGPVPLDTWMNLYFGPHIEHQISMDLRSQINPVVMGRIINTLATARNESVSVVVEVFSLLAAEISQLTPFGIKAFLSGSSWLDNGSETPPMEPRTKFGFWF